jgi:hypothetical protein
MAKQDWSGQVVGKRILNRTVYVDVDIVNSATSKIEHFENWVYLDNTNLAIRIDAEIDNLENTASRFESIKLNTVIDLDLANTNKEKSTFQNTKSKYYQMLQDVKDGLLTPDTNPEHQAIVNAVTAEYKSLYKLEYSDLPETVNP